MSVEHCCICEGCTGDEYVMDQHYFVACSGHFLSPSSPSSGCVVRKCDAGGPERDGGHVFDRVWDSEDGLMSSTICKCGVTAMSWHMMVGP